jgi:hypothetical protein
MLASLVQHPGEQVVLQLECQSVGRAAWNVGDNAASAMVEKRCVVIGAVREAAGLWLPANPFGTNCKPDLQTPAATLRVG